MRKKTGGEKMPVHMIGDILAAELSHMQAYIRFCSCQLNGAALLQQKTDEHADFKEFLKVTPSRKCRQASPVLSQEAEACGGLGGLKSRDGYDYHFLYVLSRFSRVCLFAASWTVTHQAPRSMGGNTNMAENILIALSCLSC